MLNTYMNMSSANELVFENLLNMDWSTPIITGNLLCSFDNFTMLASSTNISKESQQSVLYLMNDLPAILNLTHTPNGLWVADLETPLDPSKEVELPTTFYARSGDKTFDNYHDYALHRLNLELDRRQKRRPDLTRDRIFELMNGLDSDSIAYFFSELKSEPPVNKSNVFHLRGQDVDVRTLSKDQIFNYLITIDETEELMNLEHVRTLFHVTTPNETLHYPEAFTASPSFIHDDLHFLHILHYQFWLWFFFIFLITFFFISFLCTVRWCQLRNKPRRETRGVSRSKCGDLITAIVPVTWAISIIVGESTDASDTYDGFATNEIMVGIRAYQWGWEYFYPKDINLQYNVRPTYAAFIGNSLKYNPTSDLTLRSNALWKQYQKKELDQVITPAHLLVLPVDNHKMFSFLNFSDIGATTTNKSAAFKKIRANSKAFNTNLVHTPTTFMNRYTAINKMLVNETKFLESTNYGLKRQHNLTANAAVSCNNLNFLDQTSFNQFLEHSCKYNSKVAQTSFFNTNPHTITKRSPNSLGAASSTNSDMLNVRFYTTATRLSTVENLNFNQEDIDTKVNRSSVEDVFLTLVSPKNVDHLSLELGKKLETEVSSALADSLESTPLASDIRNSNMQLLNTGLWKKTGVVEHLDDNNALNFSEVSGRNVTNSQAPQTFSNFDKIFNTCEVVHNYELKISSPDKVVIPAEQSVRYQLGNSPQLLKRSNLNHSAAWNPIQSNHQLDSRLSVGGGLETQFLNNKSEVTDNLMLPKVLTNSSYLPAPIDPILTNNVRSNFSDYDNPNFSSSGIVTSSPRATTDWDRIHEPLSPVYTTAPSEVINILQGKKEGSLESLSNAYWQQFWANSNTDLRLEGVLKSNTNGSLFYLPLFTTYYDYDFRNAQALELLEEAYWETSYSSYSHLDYLDINDSLLTSASGDVEKNASIGFYRSDRDGNVRNSLSSNPAFLKTILSPSLDDISSLGRYYSNQVQSDDYFLPTNLLPTKDFILFTLGESDLMVEDSYLEYKNYLNLFNNNNYSSKPLVGNPSYSYSSSHVLNSFRSSYEDFTWYNDTDEVYSPSSSLTQHDVVVPNQLRFTSHPSLRLPAKNSIVTFNALQKVFRTRFDEGRMNAKTSHFGNMSVKQPFVNAGRLSYEKMLGKNKASFFSTTYFPTSTTKTLNSYSALMDSLKMAFYDFPFLLSEKSESPMYMWFDWFAKWRWIDVQPVITGKYSTIGVPSVRKFFDYNVDQNGPVADSDLYTTRISRARHNYLPNWVYTPYLYGKNQLWNKSYFDSDVFYTTQSYKNLKDTRIVCEKSYWLWQDLFIQPNFSNQFTPSISGESIHQKSTWRPFTGIQAYYYNNAILVDLLTKREFVYRNYFEKNRNVISLPRSFTTYPQHPLIKELKASFQFIDPITYGSAYSRETYYNSLSYFKFLLLKNWLLNLNTLKNSPQLAGKYLPINTKFVNDYFFYYFFGSKLQSTVGHNNELYKNQFRPLKKGITTMLRLHGTGAVAMPIEMRLRILASSRDIIHSWSVPSAGIKIDCIPGYTSHRIMTFMSPGIFWGQCQEICGRYHHWMPIICYFMKRDLFFLWCTHFIFKESSREMNNASPRQFNDYIRFASYDKSSWLSEMSNK